MTQSTQSQFTQTNKPINGGVATIFFLLGAPHVYNALRSRPAKARNRFYSGLVDRSLEASTVAIAIAGLVEVLHYSPVAIF